MSENTINANKKISIVMAYYNRKTLLKFTLDTIKNSKYTNFEIIIVDDVSSQEHKLDDLIPEYACFDIKLIKLDHKTKSYKNPCIPFNIGFKYATGDIIILQNPECCHIGDVLTYIATNLKEKQYYSMTCAAMRDEGCNQKLHSLMAESNSNSSGIEDNFYTLTLKYVLDLATEMNNLSIWYNHEKYRPYAYHFLAAIPRDVLIEINGFDDRYALGTCFDDLEFLTRIKLANIEVIIPPISENNPFCIHQWHPTRIDAYAKLLWEINRCLFLDHMKSLKVDTGSFKFD